ncbi:hypothetical protein Agabi119p4_11494 [Agaricus bisporus var. burnettii]|uniref:DUF6533 domain-containing protein n=1 Tax=Agaricus bisporus var. burnettii TaxID=192524 RepID=A0A8H7C1C5_AGABI|nr:hypothetical protein Agabi119p4_11494 [Agaricus bisporus var. burnettii]
MEEEDYDLQVKQSLAVTFVAGACLTTLVYHHVLTFSEEVTRMWTRKLSLANFLFFANRYVVEGMLIFNCISASTTYRPVSLLVDSLRSRFDVTDFIVSCVFFLRWLVVTITVNTAVVQGILVLRIWALYRDNRLAFRIALAFYIGGVLTLTGLTVDDFVGESVIIDNTLGSLPGCYPKSVPAVIAGFWIAPLIVESVLFILVILRAIAWWKEGYSVNGILVILARDSSLYYAIIFALLLSSYGMFQWGPPFLSSLLVTPSTTAGCILGSQLLLNLRNYNRIDEEISQNATMALRIRRPATDAGYGTELECGTRIEVKKEVTRHVRSDNNYGMEEGSSHYKKPSYSKPY